jgi:hypothetical protein
VDEDQRIGGSIPSPCILLIVKDLWIQLPVGDSRTDSESDHVHTWLVQLDPCASREFNLVGQGDRRA